MTGELFDRGLKTIINLYRLKISINAKELHTILEKNENVIISLLIGIQF